MSFRPITSSDICLYIPKDRNNFVNRVMSHMRRENAVSRPIRGVVVALVNKIFEISSFDRLDLSESLDVAISAKVVSESFFLLLEEHNEIFSIDQRIVWVSSVIFSAVAKGCTLQSRLIPHFQINYNGYLSLTTNLLHSDLHKRQVDYINHHLLSKNLLDHLLI